MDYTKRFKQSRDNAKSFLGMRFLDEFNKNTKHCRDKTDSDQQDEMLENAFDAFSAYLILQNSDQSK